MKKQLVIGIYLLIGALLPSCNNNVKSNAAATPLSVISAFNAKYPGVSEVKWETENKNDSVFYIGDFKMDGKEIKAEFDDNGKFLKEK